MPDRFCSACGGGLEWRRVEGDQRERQVCIACATVNYRNPRILVTGMVTCGMRLLLCRRAHEPALGLWTPPSGFMEMGETLEQAVARETEEEAGVALDPDKLILYTVTNLPSISEVYISFRATVDTDACEAGPESLELGFFEESAVPWMKLAYPEMAGYLKIFFRELARGENWIHLSRADVDVRARCGYRVIEVDRSRSSSS